MKVIQLDMVLQLARDCESVTWAKKGSEGGFQKGEGTRLRYRKIISYLPAKVNYDRMAARQLTQGGDTKWQ